jgi:hypothetical protein
MVPSITHKQLKNLVFPVYRLPKDDLEYRDGLLLHQNRVIDDKNQPGKTLGIRRAQSPHKLFRLRKAYSDVVGMLKSNHLYFIDSKGNAFHYRKTESTFIKYHKIKRVEYKNTQSLLWLTGIETPFQIPRPPPENLFWVGVLYYRGYPWKLYEYSIDKKITRRKKI